MYLFLIPSHKYFFKEYISQCGIKCKFVNLETENPSEDCFHKLRYLKNSL